MSDLRSDIAAAAARMPRRFGANRAIHNLAEQLLDGETVEALALGSWGGGTGLVVVTDHRLLLLRDDVKGQRVEDVQRRDIASVEWATGTFGGLSVHTNSNKLRVRAMHDKAGREIADLLRSRPAPAVQEPDVLGQLAKLGALRDAGVLSEEEFAAKKAELLERL